MTTDHICALISVLKNTARNSNYEFGRLLDNLGESGIGDIKFIEHARDESQFCYAMAIGHMRDFVPRDSKKTLGYLQEAERLELESGVGDHANCAIHDTKMAIKLEQEESTKRTEAVRTCQRQT